MYEEAATVAKTMDFICPYCNEAVFEILGTQKDIEPETAENTKVFVVQCLKCRNV